MPYLLQLLINALPLASLYACLAFGYALAFGMTRRADITFGALFAFAGQICLLVTDWGWNELYLVLPAALALGVLGGGAYGVLAGWAVARHVMAPLHRRSPNAVIVAGLAVVILLSETARLALDTRSLWLPPLWNDAIALVTVDGERVSLTGMQIVIVLLQIALLSVGQTLLVFTRAGRVWKAVSQDTLASRLSGIDADRVFVVTLVIAAAIASFAGLSATYLYGTMDFGSGLMFGLKVVLIAAAGGHSRPLHSAAGAAAMGVAETLWSGYGPMIWRDAVIISALVLILVFSRRERIIP